jgi:hypothetical protein
MSARQPHEVLVSAGNADAPIVVNDVSLAPIEYRGARVMTLAMMDAVHKRTDGTAGRNFRENRARLIDGEDFHEIDQPDEIRRLGFSRPQGGVPAMVLVLTETGYSMLVKSFTDNLAWDVQRQLVKAYFKPATKPTPAPRHVGVDPALSAARRSRAIASNAKTAASLCALFPGLGQAAQQTIYAKLVNAAAGEEVVPLPQVEQLMGATEVGKIYGVSAHAVGALANANCLKVEQYGEFAMDKSQYSNKQMASFRYNPAGVAKIGELLGQKSNPAPPQGQHQLSLDPE